MSIEKENLERTLRFRLEHIQNEDVPVSQYIRWAEEKAENNNIDKAYLKTTLKNHVSGDAQTTFELLEEEWKERVDEHITVEDSKQPQHESTKQTTPSIEKDPKDVLDSDLPKRERYDLASEIIAEGFESQHYARTIFSDQDPKMYYYKDGWYQENGQSKVYEYCRECLGDAYTKRLGNRVAEKVRADTYIDSSEFFDVEPGKICVKNGVLDLEKQELYDHSPREIHFQRLDVEYDSEAEYDALESFFGELFEDDEQIQLLQEIFGFCLYRKYFLKKAVIFHGDEDNGKSTVIDILTRLLGENNISGVKLQRLSKRFQKGRLVHKFANIVGDLPSEELRQTGDFKALTGGDPQEWEEKGGGTYPFTNYAKLLYSANELPRVRNPTPAFFSRWIIINFPYTFVEPSEYEEYSQEYIERNNIKKADPNPVDDLFEEQSMRGVLKFAVDGLQRLLENDEFSYTRSRQDNMTEWVRQSSSFQAFCMDCVDENPDSYVVKQDLEDAYRKYCKHHDVKHKSDRQFWKDYLVDEYGVNRAQRKRSVNGTRKNVWLGISFSDEYEADWKSLNEEHSCFILSDVETEKRVEKESSGVEEESVRDVPVPAAGELFYAEDYDDLGKEKVEEWVREGVVMDLGDGEYQWLNKPEEDVV